MFKTTVSILSIIFCFAAPFISTAQTSDKPKVNVSMSRDTILIGDRFTIDVTVEKDMTQVVDFPMFEKIAGDTIEVLNIFPVDTLKTEGRRQTIRVSYLMTCFDEGLYKIAEFPVLYADKNIVDTLAAEEVLELYVKTFIIDTTKESIADIAPQMKTPINWAEIKAHLFNTSTLIALIVLLIIAAIVYIIIRKRKHGSIFAPKPKEPAHIVAIRELEKLRDEKLWQSAHYKEYYTTLTDIIRTYLEERYNVNAMEKTSDEILSECTTYLTSKKNIEQLRELLGLADLVKFAKYTPQESSNDAQYYNAYYFVEDTKLMPHEETAETKEEEVK